MSSTSVRDVAAALDQPTLTVHKSLQKILRYYLYKVTCSIVVANVYPALLIFSLEFLVSCQVNAYWPWNILWTDVDHFHLVGAINTHNCRKCREENPHPVLQVPLYSQKVTVWCGSTTEFILGPLFFEELSIALPLSLLRLLYLF